MSERYEHDYSGKLFGAYSVFDGDSEIGPSKIVEMLNAHDRLAAQVATLRELLEECKDSLRHFDGDDCEGCKLLERIDEALGLKERGDEAARPDAEE